MLSPPTPLPADPELGVDMVTIPERIRNASVFVYPLAVRVSNRRESPFNTLD